MIEQGIASSIHSRRREIRVPAGPQTIFALFQPSGTQRRMGNGGQIITMVVYGCVVGWGFPRCSTRWPKCRPPTDRHGGRVFGLVYPKIVLLSCWWKCKWFEVFIASKLYPWKLNVVFIYWEGGTRFVMFGYIFQLPHKWYFEEFFWTECLFRWNST